MNDASATLGVYTTPGGHDKVELDDIYDGHPDGSPAPEPDDGSGGPNCAKNSKPKKCQAGTGQWITLHVFSMPASAAGR
jgi:hypothetical protein